MFHTIHTSITRNCTSFYVATSMLTRSATQHFGSTNWPTRVSSRVKGKSCNFETCLCVSLYILLLRYLSNHIHFITNGFKRFPKTNSPAPGQRVPLSLCETMEVVLPPWWNTLRLRVRTRQTQYCAAHVVACGKTWPRAIFTYNVNQLFIVSLTEIQCVHAVRKTRDIVNKYWNLNRKHNDSTPTWCS